MFLQPGMSKDNFFVPNFGDVEPDFFQVVFVLDIHFAFVGDWSIRISWSINIVNRDSSV